MQQARKFDAHGDIAGEEREVVIDIVEHATRGVHLRVELTSHGRHQDHGDSRSKENIQDDLGETENCSALEWSTALVDDEDNGQHHELTSDEVTIEVVSGMAENGALVSLGMGTNVELSVNRWQSDDSTLSPFDHVEPSECGDHQDEGESRVNIMGELGIPVEDKSDHDDNREDEQSHRIDAFDEFKGIHVDLG